MPPVVKLMGVEVYVKELALQFKEIHLKHVKMANALAV
jgi:hypothetical protein